MLLFDTSADYLQIFFYVLAFAAWAVATFVVKNLKTAKGLQILFAGVCLLFVTAVLQNFADVFYQYAVSAKVLVLAELILLLISTVLLIMAASQILMLKDLTAPLLITFVSVGLCLILYAIFVADNALLVDNIRQILPVIGLFYVFLSFLSKPKVWKYPAELTAAAAVAGLIVLMLWPMFFANRYPWYVPLDLIFLLAFAYFLFGKENATHNWQLIREKYNKLNNNLAAIVKSSPFPIVMAKLGDDSLVKVNQTALKLFGIAEDELPRYHFKDFFVDGDNRQLLLEKLEKNGEVHDFEILVKRANGNTPFWLLASANVIDYNNDVVLYAAFQDITSHKKRESLLQSQADRDPLTSLFNRRYFEAKTAQKIEAAHARKQSFAVLMIDADNFKNINDTYGHKIGDKVLIELAAVCERSLRQDDLVARYGGEEFVVFLANVSGEIAVTVADRLREAIAQIVVYADNGQPISFTVSIGVAPSGISDNINMMIKMADDAMYAAKQNGRNRVEIFKRELAEKFGEKQNNQQRLMHPVFAKEETEEISLLDGVEANHMLED